MSDYASNNLTNLIDKCREGNESAWCELIDVIAPAIFSICKKSKLSRDESFDIYGLVCYELVNNIHTLKSPDKIVYFVATMTRRKIYNFYRRMKLLDLTDIDIAGLIPDKNATDPGKEYELQRQRILLLEAMEKLPEKEYLLLKALFFDPGEPSYKEISKRLKIPVSSIGPTRGKALAGLKRILKTKKYKKTY